VSTHQQELAALRFAARVAGVLEVLVMPLVWGMKRRRRMPEINNGPTFPTTIQQMVEAQPPALLYVVKEYREGGHWQPVYQGSLCDCEQYAAGMEWPWKILCNGYQIERGHGRATSVEVW
jgi:hypothetical protein